LQFEGQTKANTRSHSPHPQAALTRQRPIRLRLESAGCNGQRDPSASGHAARGNAQRRAKQPAGELNAGAPVPGSPLTARRSTSKLNCGEPLPTNCVPIQLQIRGWQLDPPKCLGGRGHSALQQPGNLRAVQVGAPQADHPWRGFQGSSEVSLLVAAAWHSLAELRERGSRACGLAAQGAGSGARPRRTESADRSRPAGSLRAGKPASRSTASTAMASATGGAVVQSVVAAGDGGPGARWRRRGDWAPGFQSASRGAALPYAGNVSDTSCRDAQGRCFRLACRSLAWPEIFKAPGRRAKLRATGWRPVHRRSCPGPAGPDHQLSAACPQGVAGRCEQAEVDNLQATPPSRPPQRLRAGDTGPQS